MSLRLWFSCLLCALIGLVVPARGQDDNFEEDQPEVQLPDAKIARQLGWVLDVLNGREKVGDGTERFSKRFLEDFEPGELDRLLSRIRPEAFANKRVKVVELSLAEGEESLNAILQGEGTARFLSVFVALDATSGKISGLLFNAAASPESDEPDASISWDEFEGQMGRVQGSASFAAFEIVDEPSRDRAYRMVPVHAFEEERAHPIGSTFKLWVLGALAKEVGAGRLAWSDRLSIYDSLRSLPSGRMQNAPPGASFTVEEMAMEMISISDNTATDHLLERIGREQAEEFMALVTRKPERNIPMLSTRNMFAMKVDGREELRLAFMNETPGERRRMLGPGGSIATARVSLMDAMMWTTPRAIEQAEWFADCRDLCRAMAELRLLEREPGMEPLSRILRKNPGVPVNRAFWKSVAYKGGSEPGVMNLTFLLEREDGRWFTLSTSWSDPSSAFEESRLEDLARKGIELLENFDRPENPEP